MGAILQFFEIIGLEFPGAIYLTYIGAIVLSLVVVDALLSLLFSALHRLTGGK